MSRRDGDDSIDLAAAAQAVVADFAARGISAVADWYEEYDERNGWTWHVYGFQFPDGFPPDAVPDLIEVARARLRQFGYRNQTSVRVQGGVGYDRERNLMGTGERTLTYTRKFDAAFSSVGKRLKILKAKGSLQQVATGITIYARAPLHVQAAHDRKQREQLERLKKRHARKRKK